MVDIRFKSPHIPNVTFTSRDSWLLVKRSCMAADYYRVREISSWGYDYWLDLQLAPARINDSAYEEERARLFPSYGVLRKYEFDTKHPGHDQWQVGEHMQMAEFHAAWRSKRQILQTMISFWGDQVNFDMRASFEHAHDPAMAYKAHALGKFKDLLVELYSSPAIIEYLDNQSNTKKGLNENLGRELLELHTVGVNSGYTQDDVINSARILSGYKGYYYRSQDHYIGPVQVLGFSHANSRTEAHHCWNMLVAYLTYLAKHPSTARRISDRLVERFVSDVPNAALSSRLAQIYLANDTDIKPVLKALFTSAEFKASAGQKVRRPMEVLVSMLANGGIKPKAGISTNLTDTSEKSLDMLEEYQWMLSEAGNLPHYWSPPDGYPLSSQKWLSTNYMQRVWTFQSRVTGNGTHTGSPNWAPLMGIKAGVTTYSAGINLAAYRMTGIVLSRDTPMERAVRMYLGNPTWKTNPTLPASDAIMNQEAVDRLPRALMYSPINLIS